MKIPFPAAAGADTGGHPPKRLNTGEETNMTRSNDTKEAVKRRDFLKLAGTAAPAALVAVTAGTDTAEAAAPQPTNGLQDNAHTRTYYQLARF